MIDVIKTRYSPSNGSINFIFHILWSSNQIFVFKFNDFSVCICLFCVHNFRKFKFKQSNWKRCSFSKICDAFARARAPNGSCTPTTLIDFDAGAVFFLPFLKIVSKLISSSDFVHRSLGYFSSVKFFQTIKIQPQHFDERTLYIDKPMPANRNKSPTSKRTMMLN